jgi:hypothetical protein
MKPLEQVDRNLFWRRQFLNPYAFIGAPKSVADIVGLLSKVEEHLLPMRSK